MTCETVGLAAVPRSEEPSGFFVGEVSGCAAKAAQRRLEYVERIIRKPRHTGCAAVP